METAFNDCGDAVDAEPHVGVVAYDVKGLEK